MQLGPWCGNPQVGVSRCCPQCGDVAVKTTAPRMFLDSSTPWMLKPPTASISDYSSWKNTLICTWSQRDRAANMTKCLFLFPPLPHAVPSCRMAQALAGRTEQCQQ